MFEMTFSWRFIFKHFVATCLNSSTERSHAMQFKERRGGIRNAELHPQKDLRTSAAWPQEVRGKWSRRNDLAARPQRSEDNWHINKSSWDCPWQLCEICHNCDPWILKILSINQTEEIWLPKWLWFCHNLSKIDKNARINSSLFSIIGEERWWIQYFYF